ncbi:FIST C-terminal domain-containing protein [Christensenellaceae bacterium OttesenSCG-928-K19]|nr:FIST C-terminal domain-containing protein [Christensenellaceae bacterium OttesenSCG-928-K19]
MISKLATTYEIDNPELAVAELAAGVLEGPALKQNSVGILFCYSDMDTKTFMTLLCESVPFNIVGCNCIASMDDEDGFHEMAAVLLVLSADDCAFHTVVSGAVTAEGVEQQAAAVCGQLLSSAGQKPGLVLAFPAVGGNIPMEGYSQAFSKELAGIPILGGIPTTNYESGEKAAVICNTEVSDDRLVLLGITGNVHPVWTVMIPEDHTFPRKRKVVSSHGTAINRVGEQTFVEYLESMGIPVAEDTETGVLTYVTYPLVVEQEDEQGNQFSYSRVVRYANRQEGSVTVLAGVPQGATISFCTYRREDVISSVEQGMRQVLQQLGDGQERSSLLMVSCIARYLLLLPGTGGEADIVGQMLPEGMHAIGFYSGGEVAPIPEIPGKSFMYNETLVFCAF